MSQFSFSQDALRGYSHETLSIARQLGAAQTAVEVSESHGLSVSVRKGELETVEHNRDKALGVTVFLGKQGAFSHGSASTADFSPASLKATVQAAYDIARYTAVDDCSGLPELGSLYSGTPPDLALYHPWNISTAQAAALALTCESAALAVNKRITNSDGANVSASHGQFYQASQYGSDPALCRGFEGGYAYSRHSLSVSPIASLKGAMQRDYWYSSDRDPARMAHAAAVGRYAGQRTLSRLGARKIPTGQYPVLFEAPLATGLISHLVKAASGGSLYRDSSFLKDRLGKVVMHRALSIHENPHVAGAVGSAFYDDEGTPTVARSIVDAGVLNTYFLSTYSARKLGMVSTGHAGGSHNLTLSHSDTQASDDFTAMLRKLGTGLLVTELLGQGVNGITGDYSRGASGYWVQGGVIAHAVEEITIAGNLCEMYLNIVAVGADVITSGTKTTGSVLIERMAVAGS
jgi:PmbA protein